MRRGLKDEHEGVGQGSFALPNACSFSTVIVRCEGAVANHSNADVMTPVAWHAAVVCRLCLCCL